MIVPGHPGRADASWTAYDWLRKGCPQRRDQHRIGCSVSRVQDRRVSASAPYLPSSAARHESLAQFLSSLKRAIRLIGGLSWSKAFSSS